MVLQGVGVVSSRFRVEGGNDLLTDGTTVSANLKSGSAKIKSGSAKNEIGTDTESACQSGRFHEGHLTIGRKVALLLGER